jgi:hypothetical protein
VLPYPDSGPDDAHNGKYILGTNVSDSGRTVVSFFESFGFTTLSVEFDSFRESEIWLKFRK